MPYENELYELSADKLQIPAQRKRDKEISECLEQKIKEIRKKVDDNQGDVVLSVRRILVDEGDNRGCIPQAPDFLTYLEVGTISGRLIEKVTGRDIEQINLHPFVMKAHTIDTYFFFPNYQIPVSVKLRNHVTFWPADEVFEFHDSVIEKAERDAAVSFGINELTKMSGVNDSEFDFQTHQSRLREVHIAIGKVEVKRFIEGYGHRDYTSLRRDMADRLIGLLSSPDRLENRIDNYRNDKGKGLRDELVRETVRLSGLGFTLEEIQDEVMKLEIVAYGGDKGDTTDYGWSNGKLYRRYEALSEKMRKLTDGIKELVGDATNISLMSKGEVSGARFGFHSQIPVSDYIKNIFGIVSRYEATLGKIDEHLARVQGRRYIGRL